MSFDPYLEWLGIPPERRPPTYYELLGLTTYESDPEKIEQAALRRIGKVRQYQVGPRSDYSQEILTKLARARLVLIDPDRRADYDDALRAKDMSPPETITEQVIETEAFPQPKLPENDGNEILGDIVINPGGGFESSGLRPKKRKRSKLQTWLMRGVMFSCHVAMFYAAWLYWGGIRSQTTRHNSYDRNKAYRSGSGGAHGKGRPQNYYRQIGQLETSERE